MGAGPRGDCLFRGNDKGLLLEELAEPRTGILGQLGQGRLQVARIDRNALLEHAVELDHGLGHLLQHFRGIAAQGEHGSAGIRAHARLLGDERQIGVVGAEEVAGQTRVVEFELSLKTGVFCHPLTVENLFSRTDINLLHPPQSCNHSLP